jgi:hypothetical protein
LARDASGPCSPPLTCPHRKRRWRSPLPCRQAPHIPVSLIPAKHQSGLEVTDPPPPEFRLAVHQGRFALRAMISRLEGGPCRTHSDPHVSRPCTCRGWSLSYLPAEQAKQLSGQRGRAATSRTLISTSSWPWTIRSGRPPMHRCPTAHRRNLLVARVQDRLGCVESTRLQGWPDPPPQP